MIAEVYPSLWSRSFAHEGRNADQHDAYSAATWMRRETETAASPNSWTQTWHRMSAWWPRSRDGFSARYELPAALLCNPCLRKR